MKTIWKNLKYKDYKHYQVSNTGIVRNSKTKRILKGHILPNEIRKGLVLIRLVNKYQYKSIMLHKIVFDHFKTSELDKKWIWHNDFNGLNNKDTNLSNLSWGELKRKHFEFKKQKRGVYKWSDGIYTKYRAALKVNDNLVTLGYTKNKKDAEILYEFGYSLIYNERPY